MSYEWLGNNLHVDGRFVGEVYPHAADTQWCWLLFRSVRPPTEVQWKEVGPYFGDELDRSAAMAALEAAHRRYMAREEP